MNAAKQQVVREVQLPQGPFTLEAWVNGDAYGGRRGLVNKTEQSEYGLFARDGDRFDFVGSSARRPSPRSCGG